MRPMSGSNTKQMSAGGAGKPPYMVVNPNMDPPPPPPEGYVSIFTATELCACSVYVYGHRMKEISKKIAQPPITGASINQHYKEMANCCNAVQNALVAYEDFLKALEKSQKQWVQSMSLEEQEKVLKDFTKEERERILRKD